MASEDFEIKRLRLIQSITNSVVHQMIIDGAMQSCLNCYHFNEAAETCGRYGKRPPARVIVTGCCEWEDEIPF